MNRRNRTLIVLAVAVLLASLASFGVYRAIQQIPVREVQIATNFAVVAKELPGCVPPKQTFRFQRSIIRAAIAEALYRLSTERPTKAERG